MDKRPDLKGIIYNFAAQLMAWATSPKGSPEPGSQLPTEQGRETASRLPGDPPPFDHNTSVRDSLQTSKPEEDEEQHGEPSSKELEKLEDKEDSLHKEKMLVRGYIFSTFGEAAALSFDSWYAEELEKPAGLRSEEALRSLSEILWGGVMSKFEGFDFDKAAQESAAERRFESALLPPSDVLSRLQALKETHQAKVANGTIRSYAGNAYTRHLQSLSDVTRYDPKKDWDRMGKDARESSEEVKKLMQFCIDFQSGRISYGEMCHHVVTATGNLKVNIPDSEDTRATEPKDFAKFVLEGCKAAGDDHPEE